LGTAGHDHYTCSGNYNIEDSYFT